MLGTHEGNKVFSDKNIRFVTTLELIKCLKQVEGQRLRFTCAPVNELPSNISSMGIGNGHNAFLHFSFCSQSCLSRKKLCMTHGYSSAWLAGT